MWDTSFQRHEPLPSASMAMCGVATVDCRSRCHTKSLAVVGEKSANFLGRQNGRRQSSGMIQLTVYRGMTGVGEDRSTAAGAWGTNASRF
jgi:hypothetical protein